MLEAILNEDQMGIFGFGKKREKTTDNVDEGRRDFLKKAGIGAAGAFVAGKTLGLGQEAEARAKSFPVIPQEAYKIWEKYPSMQYVLDLINQSHAENANYVPLIEFILYPNKFGYGKKDFTINNVEKVKGQELNTPQYWLLNRISFGDPQISYDTLFEHPKEYGVPKLREGSGLWYFAKGLMVKNQNREQDLLKALYIGAIGDDSNVNDIVNGNFTRRPEVDKQIAEWKIQFPNWEIPFSPLGDKKYAYLIATLKTDQARDKELVALTLMALADQAKDQETIGIYLRTYNSYINRFSQMPKYLVSINQDKGWKLPLKIF